MTDKEKNTQNVIAIDGPAGSGKSTISRILAKRIHCLYLDTGAMYRAVALVADRTGVGLSNGKELRDLCQEVALRFKTDEDPPRLFSGDEDISGAIRSPEMDMLSSTVSAVKEVREAMVTLQRKMAEGVKLVAEGRDMGTVVFPRAQYKFFLTASPEIRAQRRYRERLERGESISRGLVEEELRQRDRQDQTRSLAPLKPAHDAVVIDSTALTPEEVIEKILGYLEEGF
ncbi:MAG: (d)CMP kinase [Deltaproteobacteria bacterium]|nr:(d)CMP kinase [Deltaproteobacteria bacterium]